jgi:hypothetical protein
LTRNNPVFKNRPLLKEQKTRMEAKPANKTFENTLIQIPLKKKMYQLLYWPKVPHFSFSSFMVHNPMHQSGFCNRIHCYVENKLPICKVALHSRAM